MEIVNDNRYPKKVKSEIVLELPPKKDNPRNSEGAFIDLKDGRILFMYSKFIGAKGKDDSKAVIAASFSEDKGNTWSDNKTIFTPDEHNAKNIMSISLLRMQNGDIGIFYLVRYGWHDLRLHMRRSSDEGESWSNAICCINRPGYYITNNDRVLRLSSGDLIIPTSYHKMLTDKNVQGSQSTDKRGIVYFFISDDDGYTWRESKNFCAINYANSKKGLQEPGVVEIKNGLLWAWARTDLGRQYEMFSSDMAKSWSLPQPSYFTSPCSPLSMKRIPQNGYLMAIWNPVPVYQTRDIEKPFWSWARTPLIGAISKDEGRTFDNCFIVEDDKEAGYCYAAIHYVENHLLLAYNAGNKNDGNCLARLRIKRINISDIL